MKDLINLIKEYKSLKPLSSQALEKYYGAEIVEHVYESNAIEGSTLTLRETDLVINHGLTINGKTWKEATDAIGTNKAFRYIRSNLKEQLSEEIIKNINGLVQTAHPIYTNYRTEPVRILGSNVVLPNYLKVPELMNKFVKDYNDDFNNYDLLKQPEDIDKFIKDLSSNHIRFERIHPFADGNGRTGRLLMNMECLKQGLPPIHIKVANRGQYYEAFDKYDQNTDETYMNSLIKKSMEESLEKYIEFVRPDKEIEFDR